MGHGRHQARVKETSKWRPPGYCYKPRLGVGFSRLSLARLRQHMPPSITIIRKDVTLLKYRNAEGTFQSSCMLK
ncbi:MAG: hypothetical protein HYZ44_06540 [Bacteroidetes bacterium]|nr:hypothetical protein [Bacteroidota bacterium]